MAFTQALSGMVLAAWMLSALAQSQDVLQLSVRARSPGAQGVRTLTRGDAVRSGDAVQLRVQTRVDAYVYVLALGSSGKLEMLQPFSRRAEDALQKGNEPRLIPSADEFLPLDERPGRETLFAVATADPLVDAQSWLHRLRAFHSPERVTSWLREHFAVMLAFGFEHQPAGEVRVRPLKRIPRPDGGTAKSIFTDSERPPEPEVLAREGSKISELLGDRLPDRGAAKIVLPPPVLEPARRPPAARRPEQPEKPKGLFGRLGGLFSRQGREEDEPVAADSSANPGAPVAAELGSATGRPGASGAHAAARPRTEPERGTISRWWSGVKGVFTGGGGVDGVPDQGSDQPSTAFDRGTPEAAPDPVVALLSPGSASDVAPDPDPRLEPIDLTAPGPAQAVVLVVTPGGSGTGVAVGSGNRILTSWHLVDRQPEVAVMLRASATGTASERRIRARVVRSDSFLDLALLEIDDPAVSLRPLTLARREPRMGQHVRVLGHGAGLAWSQATGVVVQLEGEQSWFSGHSIIHRGPAFRVQMRTPPGLEGAAVLDRDDHLVGLGVYNGRGQPLAVSVSGIAGFLQIHSARR